MKLVTVKLLLQKVSEFGFPPSDVNFNQMKGLPVSLENPYGYLKFFVIFFFGGGGVQFSEGKTINQTKAQELSPKLLEQVLSTMWIRIHRKTRHEIELDGENLSPQITY